MQKLRFIFAGGGTGGHFFPAMAIARAVEKHFGAANCDILFVGTKRGIEYRLRDTLGFPLELISVRGFTRALTLKNLMFPFILMWALLKSQMLLSRFQPHLVVGCGGYVSGPIVSRAAARNIATVIQEQNSFPGFTTRKLAGKVDRVYLGFTEAREYLPETTSVIVSGNPVRETFVTANKSDGQKEFGLDPELGTLVVVGGSQGARSINNAILANIRSLPASIQMVWQTGQLDFDRITSAIRAAQLTARVHVIPFTDRMDLAYAVADLTIARAGALTIAELEASRTPAILIPYPHAAGNHQTHNARSYAKYGGATVVSDQDLNAKNLVSSACEMIEDGKAGMMRQTLEEKSQGREQTALETIVGDIAGILDRKGLLS